MLPHQERVVEEKKQLDERLEKLTAFNSDDNKLFLKLPSSERHRMRAQESLMTELSKVLGQRILFFKGDLP